MAVGLQGKSSPPAITHRGCSRSWEIRDGQRSWECPLWDAPTALQISLDKVAAACEAALRRDHTKVQAAMGSWTPQGLWSLISFSEQGM